MKTNIQVQHNRHQGFCFEGRYSLSKTILGGLDMKAPLEWLKEYVYVDIDVSLEGTNQQYGNAGRGGGWADCMGLMTA